MGNYVLSCSSTVDLRREQLEERDIHYICFHFELGDKQYMDDLGKSISLDEFYRAMANGENTKTSQINVEEYEQYFEGFLKEGKDILHLTLSSGISGTINSAMIARDTLCEKYPNRKIYVLDSLAASSGYGLLMDKLADLRDGGMSIDDLYHWAEDNRLKLQHWFFTSDLTYLIRGGRVSKAAGIVGGMLNICPLLNVDYQGRLINRAKVRTKRKVIQATVDKMKKHAQDGADYSGKCYISQSACMEDARAVAELVEAAFPKMQGKVAINDIGTTIGSHTGPGTVALFFWGDERVD
ncbi:MAG: DegV family protein [Acetatifactor sp.]|nr:DegV family protein [Acetatifactor sp.]